MTCQTNSIEFNIFIFNQFKVTSSRISFAVGYIKMSANFFVPANTFKADLRGVRLL